MEFKPVLRRMAVAVVPFLLAFAGCSVLSGSDDTADETPRLSPKAPSAIVAALARDPNIIPSAEGGGGESNPLDGCWVRQDVEEFYDVSGGLAMGNSFFGIEDAAVRATFAEVLTINTGDNSVRLEKLWGLEGEFAPDAPIYASGFYNLGRIDSTSIELTGGDSIAGRFTESGVIDDEVYSLIIPAFFYGRTEQFCFRLTDDGELLLSATMADDNCGSLSFNSWQRVDCR